MSVFLWLYTFILSKRYKCKNVFQQNKIIFVNVPYLKFAKLDYQGFAFRYFQ